MERARGGNVRALYIHKHSGAHRILSPGCNITRPPGSDLTTTLETIFSGKKFISSGCCLFRRDNNLWHTISTLNRPFASCLKMVTIMSGKNTHLSIVVRDKGDSSTWAKYYLINIPLMEGLTHLSWCQEMGLGVYSKSIIRKARFGSAEEKEYFGQVFDEHEGPSIFLTPKKHYVFHGYQYNKDDGKYHFEGDDYPYTFTPSFYLKDMDVCFIPPYVHLYSAKGDTLPIWSADLLKTHVQNEYVEVPSVDITKKPHNYYVHLRYVPRIRKGMGYRYTTINRDEINVNNRIRNCVKIRNMEALWNKTPEANLNS